MNQRILFTHSDNERATSQLLALASINGIDFSRVSDASELDGYGMVVTGSFAVVAICIAKDIPFLAVASNKIIDLLARNGIDGYYVKDVRDINLSNYHCLSPSVHKMKKSKKVVYTVSSTDIREYPIKRVKMLNGWDFICFVNGLVEETNKNGWRLVPIELDANSLDQKRKESRKVKILNHRYLSEYDISVYIDTKFVASNDLDEFVYNALRNHDLCLMRHNKREYIYDEALLCKKSEKDDGNIDRQINDYREEGFPDDVGLYAPGIMIRRHGNKKIEEFMEHWWSQVEKYSYRDIISFSYTLWKHPISFNALDFKSTYQKFRP